VLQKEVAIYNYLNFYLINMPRNNVFLYLLYLVFGLILTCLSFLYVIPHSFWQDVVDAVVVGFILVWYFSTLIVMAIHEFLKPDMSISRVFVGLYYIVFVIIMTRISFLYVIPVSLLEYDKEVTETGFVIVMFLWLKVAEIIHDLFKTAQKNKLEKE